jgi:type IV pilus assembly protein PilO
MNFPNLPRGKFLSFLNLHLLAAALLVGLNLVLAVRLAVAWHTLHESSPQHLDQERSAYRTLQLEMLPLHGLPEKVDQSREQAAAFYAERFPDAYSTISAAMGDLADQEHVRLARLTYTQTPAIPGLAEVRMDASLSGEYAPIMHFINGLERSKTFFLINAITLTGQQGGLVNLRLRVTTYLHGADVGHLVPPASNSQGNAPDDSLNGEAP